MHPFIANYRLRDGQRGRLHILAASSCDAVIAAIDAFGEQLKACSVRPA